MRKTTIFDVAVGILLIVMINFAFYQIAMRHLENVQNTVKICQKIGIEYSTKTNWVGNITRVYVK